MKDDLVSYAIEIAAKAHYGQTDKVGEPYIFHPLRVMLAVQGIKERCVAVLHDVLEDTDMTEGELYGLGMTSDIVVTVKAMTKKTGEDYDSYIRRVAGNPCARVVKIADIRDNASPIRLYKLQPATVQRLTSKYVKALQHLEYIEDADA